MNSYEQFDEKIYLEPSYLAMRVACVQDDSVVVGHGLHQRVSLLLENIIIHCHKGKMAHQQVLFWGI